MADDWTFEDNNMMLKRCQNVSSIFLILNSFQIALKFHNWKIVQISKGFYFKESLYNFSF